MKLNPGPYWAIVNKQGKIVEIFHCEDYPTKKEAMKGCERSWDMHVSDIKGYGYRCIRVTVEEVKE